MRKSLPRRNFKLYTSLFAAAIIVFGYFLWLDRTYAKLQADWLARDPNVVYPEKIQTEFLEIINEVGYFKKAEDTIFVTGGFEKWFSITGYKDDFGPNLRFRSANACITFDNYFSEQEIKGMLDDLYRIGFLPDRYSSSTDDIIDNLSGEKTIATDEIAPSQYFESSQRSLSVVTPFKESDRTITGFACLTDK